ncbi:2-deoxy-D-gluconate 3-dehydrogenase [Trichodelitschia bisporula]|uniref:2-deoxy-D-gluconate 3-dehydrogenase n=1 Tax=Trichodelitschia bisporula TaxID=703511 RepID=A0A6G1HL86_9PEZI|nr:2-deoxy-D-gluconate 3-dehydrogenase [Trichodelitschia bisporula]
MSPLITSLFSLEGKTAIVLGATGGLGQAMTTALAEAGANIVSVELPSDSQSEALRSNVEKAGRTHMVFHSNVGDAKSLRGAFAQIWEKGVVPDILLNCAGIQRRGKVEEITDKDLDDVLNVNLKASFIAAQEFGKELLRLNRPGKIINIASIISFIGNVDISPYAASKGGVLQFTKAFSNEWSGKGINVNCICPGYIRTPLTQQYSSDPKYKGYNEYIIGRTPIGRWGEPQDLVGAVIYLASRASDFVTGTSIVCDGGLLAK